MRTDTLSGQREPKVTQSEAVGAVRYCPIRDRALLAWSAIWTVLVLVSFGLVTAIIPNPIFGRGIAPEPFAIAVWIVSAPLMGLAMATYFAPMPAVAPIPLGQATRRDGSAIGTLGGVAAFLAIGCPTCNKIALLLLGASGAVSTFGPIQPVLGAISLALLAGTVVWRMRLRARGGSCPAPQHRPDRS